MVGRMSAGRCCCPGGGGDPSCIVYDEIDDDPSYTICAGGWTIDQTAGTYYTNDADSKLIFTSAATGNSWRFRISVQIEKMSTPFVGDGVAKIFAAASQCSNGETISLTKDYDGSSFVSGTLAISGDTLDILDSSIYDIEICSDGTAVTVYVYDPFENVITTRTFSFTGGVFGIGTGALGADVRVTFYNPRLENINGFQCPNCTPSCCYGPVPDEMVVQFTGFPSEWISLRWFEVNYCGGSDWYVITKEYLSNLNAEITLTRVAGSGTCVWEGTVGVSYDAYSCDAGPVLNIDNVPYDAIIRLTVADGYVVIEVFLLNGNKLVWTELMAEPACDLICAYDSVPLFSKPEEIIGATVQEEFPTNPTAQFKTPCLAGFAMPAKGYGIPKDPNTKPTPEPELPEDVKQWLMQQAPSSKTRSSSSESEPTKDAVAPN